MISPEKLVDIPVQNGTVLFNTGYDMEIAEFVSRYFRGITDYLGYSQRACDAFVIAERHPLGIEKANNFLPSDDRVNLLIIREKLSAQVLEWRNEQNHIIVAPSHFLTPRLVSLLRAGVVDR